MQVVECSVGIIIADILKHVSHVKGLVLNPGMCGHFKTNMLDIQTHVWTHVGWFLAYWTVWLADKGVILWPTEIFDY